MRNSMATNGWMAGGAAALALLMPGCVGYRLGTTLPPDVKTIYVATFVNQTGEPGIETAATRATRQEFQKDGTLRIVDDGKAADIVLTTTLSSYKLAPVRFQKDNPKAAQEYRLHLTADIVAVMPQTGRTVAKRRVDGETTFQFSGDLPSAKVAALPTAAADLAHRIVGDVVEAW
jgi:hypothetical protein